MVTNTPDVLSDATAELAMLLMLGAARHAVAGDRIVRTGGWDSWSPAFMVGKQVTGRASGHYRDGPGRAGLLPPKPAGLTWISTTINRTELPADQAQGATYHDMVESLLGVAIFCRCIARPRRKRPI